MQDLHYYLGFSHFLGIGPTRFNLLRKTYQTLEKAYNAPLKELQELIGSQVALKFADFRQKFDPEKKLQEIRKKNISVLTRETIPQQLKNLEDAPICLYVKGDLDSHNFEKDFLFAIVGTRKPTSYGELVARKLATDLVLIGMTIVSGLALGIDKISHQAALENNGKTIAFLGCGVDIVYPPANYYVYHEILKKRGLIISEFPPGMSTLKGLFVARNRLISGLSRGVLVVEGLKNSGSLITARYAAEQGIEVFAPPAPITSQMAEAPNLLIKEGAKMVTSVTDILEEYEIEIKKVKTNNLANLSIEEKTICDFLVQEPHIADDISAGCKIPIYKILPILSSLEIQGVIEKNSEGKYQVRN